MSYRDMPPSGTFTVTMDAAPGAFDGLAATMRQQVDEVPDLTLEVPKPWGVVVVYKLRQLRAGLYERIGPVSVRGVTR